MTKPSAIPNQNRGAKERLARAAEEARTAKSLIEEVDDQSLRLAKLNRQGLLTIQAADTEKRKLVAKSQQALRHSERALGLNRSSEVAWVQKASALFLLKGTPWLSSPERAMNVVDEALRRFPDNVDLRDLKAKLQKTVGRGRV